MKDFTTPVICLLLVILTSICLQAQDTFSQKGIASFYSDKFEGKATASGEKYRAGRMTAAHRSLPFGTVVKVINLQNGKSVEVKINDRGPFVEGRIIDLSRAAAEELGIINQGLAEVRLEVIDAVAGKESSYNLGKPSRAQDTDLAEWFEIDVKGVIPRGWGVQIGTFGESDNLIRMISEMKGSFSKKIVVQTSQFSDRKIYKIIVGVYPSRKKAEVALNRLRDTFPDCFIVHLQGS